MKVTVALSALFFVFQQASAEIQHTSTTKNLKVSNCSNSLTSHFCLQIPRGSFSHLRLVGSGMDDANIDADITSVGYQVRISQTKNSNQKFDLYFFSGNDDDYNCFVMGAQLWADYGKKHECDFVTMRPERVKASIADYSEESETFLDSNSKTDEVFLVIDNSGWYHAITNPKVAPENDQTGGSDVHFQIELTTYYKDNDIYNSVYRFFVITASVVASVLLLFLIALKCLRVKYNKLMEQRAAFKQ